MSGRLVSRQFVLTCAVALGLFLNYQSLSVLTPYFVALTGASSVAVGAVTAAFMIAATVSSVAVGLVPTTTDFRWALLASLVLLCVPAFVFPFLTSVPAFLVASTIRGFGFGAAGVLVGTIAATIAPPGRRGLALGIVGMITSGCAIVGQSGTLVLAGRFGFASAFLLVAALSLLTALVILPLPRLSIRSEGSKAARLDSASRVRLLMPSIALFFACMVYGAVISFAALDLHTGAAGAAPLFFLVLAGAIPATRLVAGGMSDRVGYTRILLASVVLGCAGMWTLGTYTAIPAAAISAALFGTCFGTLTSGTQVELTRRVTVAQFGVANGIFSSAWNAGMGVGGVTFGLLAAQVGYGSMFKLTSAFLIAAAAAVVIDHRLVGSSAAARADASPTRMETTVRG